VEPVDGLHLSIHGRRSAYDTADWIDRERTGIELGRPVGRVVEEPID